MTSHEIDKLARRRAAAKLGWFIHAFVFVAVNLVLAGLSVSAGKAWAVFPAFGWGLGLAIHGAVVFLLANGAGLHDTLVERERQRLSLQRDPW